MTPLGAPAKCEPDALLEALAAQGKSAVRRAPDLIGYLDIQLLSDKVTISCAPILTRCGKPVVFRVGRN